MTTRTTKREIGGINVVLAVVVTVALGGRQPEGGPTGREPANPPPGGCRTELIRPWRPVITQRRLLRGEARSSCRTVPVIHKVTLYLQRQSPSGWEIKDSETSPLIPPPSGILLLVLTECAPGNWRLRSEVAVTWSNGQRDNPSGNSDVLRVRSRQDCEHTR